MGKAVKAVKKVFKKIAPIVLPIALGAIPSVGPILAATMGSGIGTLISGGSFKQALMSAAMGAAFSGGITSLASKFGPVSLGKAFAGQSAIKRGIGTLAQKMVNMTGGPLMQTGTKGGITSMIGRGINTLRGNLSKGLAAILPNAEAGIEKITGKFEFAKQTPAAIEAGLGEAGDIFSRGAQLGIKDTATTAAQQALAPSFMTSAGRAAQTELPAQTTKDILSKAAQLGTTVGARVDTAPVTTGDTTKDPSLWKKITGGTAKWWNELGDTKYGKAKQIALAGLAGAAAYGGYKALTTKEIEEMSPDQLNKRMQSIGSPTDPRYVSQFNPTGMYSSFPGRITQDLFKYDYPTAGSLGPNLQPWTGAAKGGIMNSYAGGGLNFPKKQGQINGPGTDTSDDVPAMLSDGEFVMTSQAVRNAGGGSRALGSRRMYNLMNNLEQGVA